MQIISNKKKYVNKVFDTVNNRYDIMNDLMSFGLHRVWKDLMVEWLNPKSGKNYIDVAGGTGDVAYRIYQKTKSMKNLMICDPNERMIKECFLKFNKKKIQNKDINYICADSDTLPFENNTFDGYTVAFGLRNFSDVGDSLKETFRILKPGGRFMCLEFFKTDTKKIDKLYKMYSNNINPQQGEVIVGDREPYEYLVKSIKNFSSQDEVLNIMEKIGFKFSKFRSLFMGVVSIHTGWKI